MKIKKKHIKLLAAMAELMETEANFGFVPEFNAKRPFGNSMSAIVARDALEVLGEDVEDFEYDDRDRINEALNLVRECTPVLKAILRSGDLYGFVGMKVPEQ
jgi:hypothetical protein